MTPDRLNRSAASGVLNSSHALITDHVSQRFCREVVVWNALRHKNVLPLLGVTMTEDQLVMVSEWMVGGNIMEFVNANVHADRLKLVSFSYRP